MNKIKHLFFDLDDTIWDFSKNSNLALQELYKLFKVEEKYQINFKQWHRVYKNENAKLWLDLRNGTVSKQELRDQRFKRAFKEFGIDDLILSKQFEDNYLITVTKFNFLVEGALEILEYLYKKYELHILTNGFSEVTKHKLKSSSINHFFKTVTCADELETQKPDPKIFELALSKAFANPNETAFIGDNWVSDIEGANNFGLMPIFFDRGDEESGTLDVLTVKQLIEIKKIF